MIKVGKGSLTILMASSMVIFLSFCLVLMEGVRVYFFKTKALQAMELAKFSVLSDYQQELFRNYGVFFIDLDYEKNKEQSGILEERAEKYITMNAEELENQEIAAVNFRRATDGKGIAFFQQAVELEKVKSGYKALEEVMEAAGNFTEESVDLGALLEENQEAAEGVLGEYTDEEGTPIWDISLPNISFPSVELLTDAVFGSEEALSDRSVDIKERIGRRKLVQGTGKSEEISITEMQLFHGYLFGHFTHYGNEDSGIPNEALKYQLEYIIAGKSNDRKNLENVMWRIFLLRAGGDYLFYHQDTGKLMEAEAIALAIAGFTANPILIQSVQELVLITWAIEDAIDETKEIYAGEKVPIYEDGVFSGIKLGYQEYLYLFLNLTGSKDKIYRSMDLVELEVRKLSGYEQFRLDHCTDWFELEWTYRFDSLFEWIPLLNGGHYENTVKRTMKYET